MTHERRQLSQDADVNFCKKMSTCKGMSTCSRLLSVAGLLNRVNDVIICGDLKKSKEHVLYFGGDVQDYKENMESHRDNKRYAHWNLEDTAQLIHSKFPGSTVLVIKPSKMHLKTFSVYNNFVESNDFGCPSHSTEYGAISNLSKLYQNILSLSDAGPHPLSLIGFSKGCVVLNQIVHELVGLDTLDKESNEFVKRIQQFYWLDGGHSGGKNTWVTDGSSLTALAQLNCDIHVHVTPYQVKDAMRSWIGREEKKFVNTLKRLGANLSHVLHFESEERCIENHFKVLQEFR